MSLVEVKLIIDVHESQHPDLWIRQLVKSQLGDVIVSSSFTDVSIKEGKSADIEPLTDSLIELGGV